MSMWMLEGYIHRLVYCICTFMGFIFVFGFALMETLVGFARTDLNEAINSFIYIFYESQVARLGIRWCWRRRL
jgi:hypothetical protein